MPSLTPTEPQTTDELPTGRLPDAGPAVPAATVRITTVALLPPAARRVAKPRAKAQTQPSATPKGQPKTKAQPSAKPQAPGAASAQAPAAPKRRKRPAAAAKAAAARIEAVAPARRFGLTAREQLTVPLGLLAAATFWFVPTATLLMGFLLLSTCPALLTIAAPLCFLSDVVLICTGRQACMGFGLKPAVYGAIGMCLGVLILTGPMSASPVMLDLTGDGRLGTTAASTARAPQDRTTSRTVSFDLAGRGQLQTLAWSDGGGDAFVVDDRDGGATRAARGAGVIDGTRLFGDEGGRWASGYDKLATLDADLDGQLTGAELTGLAAWIDNGDARLGRDELVSLAALGVTALDVRHQAVTNARGEILDQAGFTRHGRRGLTEDVWFPIAR